MDLIWSYRFEDGTKLFLVNNGLSGCELEKMVELHGKVELGCKKAIITYC
nr:hypothetical protein [uncultured Lachnoclostridium sp.]